jgi:hypothetical protein
MVLHYCLFERDNTSVCFRGTTRVRRGKYWEFESTVLPENDTGLIVVLSTCMPYC